MKTCSPQFVCTKASRKSGFPAASFFRGDHERSSRSDARQIDFNIYKGLCSRRCAVAVVSDREMFPIVASRYALRLSDRDRGIYRCYLSRNFTIVTMLRGRPCNRCETKQEDNLVAIYILYTNMHNTHVTGSRACGSRVRASLDRHVRGAWSELRNRGTHWFLLPVGRWLFGNRADLQPADAECDAELTFESWDNRRITLISLASFGARLTQLYSRFCILRLFHIF